MAQIVQFFRDIFKSSDFSSFWQSGNWTQFHAWLYIISDLMIWAAFFIIPILIIYYLHYKGEKVRFNGLYSIFAIFLLISGITYFMDAIMFWIPFFRITALMRFATAIISWVTVYYVIKILPVAYAMKSPATMQEEIDRRLVIERELKAKNERLLEAEQTAKLGYGEWDIIRKSVTLSDMSYHILDIPLGTILTHQMLMEQVHPADLRFVEDSIRKNLKAKEFQQFYFRIITKEMMLKHVLVKGEIMRNAIGEPISIRGTMQDVTELRRHMQKVEQQNKKLKKIAWVQSHRMRAPVATILGMAELFNHSDPADPMNKEILANIHELTLKLDDMIKEVDTLTRGNIKTNAA